MVDDQDMCEWVMFLLVPAHPGQRAVKRCGCCCSCYFAVYGEFRG